MAKNNDGFFDNVGKMFRRFQKDDLLRVGAGTIDSIDTPKQGDELKRNSTFKAFRQYLQQKNWSTRHIELYNEYRKMDDTFPIASSALKIYAQEMCLSGDTVVRTTRGDFTINELIAEKYNKNFFCVQIYSQHLKRSNWGMCQFIKSNGVKKVFKVTIERSLDEETELLDTVLEPSFKCTENHKILLPDFSFKELKQLKPGDEIFSFYKYKDPGCDCYEDVTQKVRIVSIEEAGEEEVYDLVNVEPDSHFSIKVSDTIFLEVHNCSKGDDGNIIKIIHKNKEVVASLEKCLIKNLKINSKGYLLSKELLKFGNVYGYLDIRRGEGVVDLIHLPPEFMRIELLQNANSFDDYQFNWTGGGGGSNFFQPWEVVHFKILEDISLQPYGTSIFRSVVDTWRRIILMREAIIIYRITRAPQRYLFKLDTSGMSPDEALDYADKMEQALYKKPIVNPNTNEIDFKSNVLNIEENLFMPTFEGDVGGVEVLEGASNLSDIEDFKIIKEDFFAGLLIPKAFLTFEEGLCLRGNVKIFTNEGIKTIEQLSIEVAKEPRKKKYVLSCNEFGYVTSGKVLWCKETKKVNELYRVHFENDGVEEFTECTGNHPFLMDNLEYKDAMNLVQGDNIKNILGFSSTVTRVELFKLDVEEAVYDLEVDDLHNFALESKVFVHNSNKAALKGEDLRFGNAVKQYQSYLLEGLLHIAVVHLHSLGFSQEDIEGVTIEMNTSSAELKKMEMELLQTKYDTANKILENSDNLPIMSYTQVLKDIMEFTEDDIKTLFESLLIERKMLWRLNKIKEDGFYEEPEQNKQDEIEKLYGSKDVFSQLTFERKEISKGVKSILSEKVKKEIQELAKIKTAKTDKHQVQKIIKMSIKNDFKQQFLKDIGIISNSN